MSVQRLLDEAVRSAGQAPGWVIARDVHGELVYAAGNTRVWGTWLVPGRLDSFIASPSGLAVFDTEQDAQTYAKRHFSKRQAEVPALQVMSLKEVPEDVQRIAKRVSVDEAVRSRGVHAPHDPDVQGANGASLIFHFSPGFHPRGTHPHGTSPAISPWLRQGFGITPPDISYVMWSRGAETTRDVYTLGVYLKRATPGFDWKPGAEAQTLVADVHVTPAQEARLLELSGRPAVSEAVRSRGIPTVPDPEVQGADGTTLYIHFSQDFYPIDMGGRTSPWLRRCFGITPPSISYTTWLRDTTGARDVYVLAVELKHAVPGFDWKPGETQQTLVAKLQATPAQEAQLLATRSDSY